MFWKVKFNSLTIIKAFTSQAEVARIFEDQARLLESQAFGNLSSKQKAGRPSFNTHIRFEKKTLLVSIFISEKFLQQPNVIAPTFLNGSFINDGSQVRTSLTHFDISHCLKPTIFQWLWQFGTLGFKWLKMLFLLVLVGKAGVMTPKGSSKSGESTLLMVDTTLAL